ncbi:hypothetical protein ACN42_g1968 [Penicillium freii]|uniref:Uncharacterized protein n=1 Tax=Penicillium freii TaxID=48697 RepID=A0A101MQZ8_PENFR|nr:hypothetical protein ACN42_g1968 [Penicillium freii]
MRTVRIGLRRFLFKIKAAETDPCNCDEGSQTPKLILMQCPRYVIPRTKLCEQLWDIGINEMDYDKIVSNPQATRYVVNFMHRIGLLQQFQYVIPEDDNDEPIGLAAMDLASVYSLEALCASSSAFGFEFLLRLDEAPA